MTSNDPSKEQLPKAARQLLHWFIREELLEEVEGDLLEKHVDQIKKKRPWKAKLSYWYQVLHYFRPFALRDFNFLSTNLPYMFQNYLKITFRNIFRQRLHSLINILGLSVFRLVFIAFLIAIPCSYFFLNQWLERFAYQVSTNWWLIFLIAGISTIALTFATISFKSIHTALHSPVESLRAE